MMLNETYTKNIQPRDPERIRSDIETPCATVYNQGVTPVLYDNAVQASSRPGRAVEYLPENTIALSVSECVMMFLIPPIFVLLSLFIFSKKYKLSKERMEEVTAFITEKHEQEPRVSDIEE